MKATGIVRAIDDLGRITIPKEIRRTNNLEVGDPLEIFTDGSMVCLQKYQISCTFCGERKDEELIDYKGKKICKKCIRELGE